MGAEKDVKEQILEKVRSLEWKDVILLKRDSVSDGIAGSVAKMTNKPVLVLDNLDDCKTMNWKELDDFIAIQKARYAPKKTAEA